MISHRDGVYLYIIIIIVIIYYAIGKCFVDNG